MTLPRPLSRRVSVDSVPRVWVHAAPMRLGPTPGRPPARKSRVRYAGYRSAEMTIFRVVALELLSSGGLKDQGLSGRRR